MQESGRHGLTRAGDMGMGLCLYDITSLSIIKRIWAGAIWKGTGWDGCFRGITFFYYLIISDSLVTLSHRSSRRAGLEHRARLHPRLRLVS